MKKTKTIIATLCLLGSTATFAGQETAVNIDPDSSLSSVQPRVMNGEAAAHDLLPWQVMVFGQTTGTMCGGSIISEHWIVTAAHCTFKMDAGNKVIMLQKGDYIFAGTTNPHLFGGYLDKNKGTLIEEVITHQGYNPEIQATRFDNDIALIRVNESLYARGGKAIKIASFNQPNLATAEQTQADQQFGNTYVKGQDSQATLIASGWGHLGTQNKTSDTLQVVKLAGIPDSQCDSSPYKGDYFVCADSNRASVKKDVCRGDSGGPLIWQNPANVNDADKGLRLVGATSNGPLCSAKNDGLTDGDGLYTQVSYYRQWIEGKTGLDLDAIPMANYKYDPFKVVKDVPPKQPKQPDSDSSGGGGGSVPLLSLVALGLFGWLRRNK
ncbi:S1 family peptidase [Photobacterium sanguinicancri]|uniref:GlyGly-CTERM sorting domain-containing protein n=1 Tax=Photobacterium sanguinicancri TaxID=875932 RepID=A0ABX4FZ69_9GAMM|nr:serine protease [Photobacterium sanguinicancri]OZS44171.1 GlyGly-CTERM sorting domain-containing protein [Photobacterium sanguinicancri]